MNTLDLTYAIQISDNLINRTNDNTNLRGVEDLRRRMTLTKALLLTAQGDIKKAEYKNAHHLITSAKHMLNALKDEVFEMYQKTFFTEEENDMHALFVAKANSIQLLLNEVL